MYILFTWWCMHYAQQQHQHRKHRYMLLHVHSKRETKTEQENKNKRRENEKKKTTKFFSHPIRAQKKGRCSWNDSHSMKRIIIKKNCIHLYMHMMIWFCSLTGHKWNSAIDRDSVDIWCVKGKDSTICYFSVFCCSYTDLG